MKRAIAVIIIPILILSFSGLSSCKNRAEKKEIKKIELNEVDTIKSEIEKNVYPLPTSAEVIKMLSELEVGYILGIANPVANARKYLTSILVRRSSCSPPTQRMKCSSRPFGRVHQVTC